MQQQTNPKPANQVVTILKWILSVVFFISMLGSLIDKAIVSAIIFLFITLLLLPPLTNFWTSIIPPIRNKILKGGLLFVLFIVGIATNPNISKKSNKTGNISSTIDFDTKKKILITYIKKDTTDKSLQNIRSLVEVGNMFENYNYSIERPAKGYITEQYDSAKKVIVLTFNPKFDFTDEEKAVYLIESKTNGKLKDYIIKFEMNDKGEMVSKKTYINYSIVGEKEFDNSEVPALTTLIDEKTVNSKKEIIAMEKQALQQKEEQEKRSQDFKENCLSSYDHSHRGLVKLVKQSMHNPKSFEHVETRYGVVKDEYAGIVMIYRGTNGFGAIVTNSIKAKVNLKDCSVISVEEQ